MLIMAYAMSVTACQSSQTRQQDPQCPLAPGMSTDQLASCGCFSISNNDMYADSLSQGDLRQQVQTVIIQNYLCPRESTGLAKVVVINGIAKDVFE